MFCLCTGGSRQRYGSALKHLFKSIPRLKYGTRINLYMNNVHIGVERFSCVFISGKILLYLGVASLWCRASHNITPSRSWI